MAPRPDPASSRPDHAGEGESEIRPARGHVVIIGGREDREGDRHILSLVARAAGDGPLVVVTAASGAPDEVYASYEEDFHALGVRDVRHLRLRNREHALDPLHEAVLEDARVVFFSGGDQLRLTAKLGGTHLADAIRALYERGTTLAGTSAGASAIGDPMMVLREPPPGSRLPEPLDLARGLGYVPDLIVDQHFAQRHRMGRLIRAVSRNPRVLGIGVDEDTAAVVEAGRRFRVLGSGAIYVVDGHGVRYTSFGEVPPDATPSVFGLRLHVLNHGDSFDLETRDPLAAEDAADR